MADQPLPHVDVAGLLLGDLDDDEHRQARDHVADCDACRTSLDELRDVADRVLMAGPAPQPPADLGDRVLAAVHDRATADEPADTSTSEPVAESAPTATDPHTRPSDTRPTDTRPAGAPGGADPRARRSRRGQRRWGGRVASALAAVAVAVLAFVVGVEVSDRAPGEVELQAQLASPDGALDTAVTVRRLETGRAVDVTSTQLPILPDGGIYELWFVGPGDSPESPNRISAGTFHPDQEGNTQVELHAAVVPADYPTVVITAEPNNGDPAPNGPEVVRSVGG